MNIQPLKQMDRGIYPTLNKYGYTHSKPLKFSQKFVDYCQLAKKPVLDIGATYGVNTIPALRNGATVIANDVEEQHLDILLINTPKKYRKKLEIKIGRIPTEIDFEDGSLDAVLASGVLHFLQAKEFMEAIHKIYKWLAPGGKFFFETSSVYNKLFAEFLPIYNNRKKQDFPSPGYVEDTSLYVKKLSNYIPVSLTLFTLEDIVKILAQTKFQIEEIGYFSFDGNHNQSQVKVDESIGLIAQKPVE